jgi:hypothetical protein
MLPICFRSIGITDERASLQGKQFQVAAVLRIG